MKLNTALYLDDAWTSRVFFEIFTKIKPELRNASVNRLMVDKMSFSPSGLLKTDVAPVLHSEHAGNRLTFKYRFEPHDEAAPPLPLWWSHPRTGGQTSCRRSSWTVSRPWQDLLLAPSASSWAAKRNSFLSSATASRDKASWSSDTLTAPGLSCEDSENGQTQKWNHVFSVYRWQTTVRQIWILWAEPVLRPGEEMDLEHQ